MRGERDDGMGCSAAVRSILLEQPGVFDAGADYRAGTGWVIFEPNQVTAEELAQSLSQYYPSKVVEVQPYQEE